MQLQNHLEPMVVDPSNEENDNQEEEAVIVENSNLDLDSFSSSYSGLGRLYRLIFVADRCPGLREEALLMALAHVQTTCNVALYNKILQKLHQPGLGSCGGGAGGSNLPDVAGGGGAAEGAGSSSGATRSAHSLPSPDIQWIEAKTKKATLKLEKLDADLKTYKANNIKESIRRGNDDLGDHHLDCGELSNALKCYSRSRDYCTSHLHILTMCLNVIKVSIYLQNWSHVLSYTLVGGNKDQSAVVQTKLACAAGLAQLATKKYKSAAKSFLTAQLDSCTYSEVLSPWNVAVYGGLCALATFTRHELHKHVIMSSSFKQFLELEPQLRDLIFKFYQSKYAQCLRLLDHLRDTLMLDMYLSLVLQDTLMLDMYLSLVLQDTLMLDMYLSLVLQDTLMLDMYLSLVLQDTLMLDMYLSLVLQDTLMLDMYLSLVLQDTLMLDMYLASHVKTLYGKIRNRGLVQYFSPFKSASLERMAVAFNTSVSGLEDELMALILDGLIQARIDSHNKIVYAACVEERSVTFERTLEMGQQHIDRLHMLVLRAALMRQQMHVKPPSREAMPGASGSSVDPLADLQAS
ncbi:26S proteasome regulatory subunit Rpn7/COP9 signalosome complex subunit 1 [Trinorchestia longiramus]|nr:26S proteasome regulatory subunit Rpn7/COP9 signalosome complex subunit 1 [Trinorchestia longiramus]